MTRVGLRRTIPVRDQSAAAAVRAATRALGLQLGFTAARIGEMDLVVTEACTNAVVHGGGGEALVVREGDTVRFTVFDQGPGMDNVERCARDGYSTADTPGHGLGTVLRLSTESDIASAPERGTVVDTVLAASARTLRTNAVYDVGGLVRAYPGEAHSGDAIAYRTITPERFTVCVVDGLGHGRRAAEIADQAIAAFDAVEDPEPESIVRALHEALRGARGAVVGVATFSGEDVRICTLGNIDVFVLGAERDTRIAATHGTAGSALRRLKTDTIAFGADDVCVLHSDGVRQIREPRSFPGVIARRASTIAALYYRDHERRTDDASIAVIRRGMS